ncbi:TIGR03084 family metal-binding protein [Catellatospora sp. KI3]|uniref:TIGR03084 family metal-binding protein n=1 Tax=Catellatospora sp. KI3 TaxID=3041620 RepID=UPI0024832ADC|nr:TIGR03084 family metal-binding protein [Catellatospora sp. KI3]MDI1461468.1 TIGR03084 family metal-binding protein [Catellatospora sp. KI3]
MTQTPDVVAALTADGDAFDRMVTGLGASGWDAPTPAEGWTVKHQVAHLTSIFWMAEKAAAAPEAFTAMSANLGPNFNDNVAKAMAPFLGMPNEMLLVKWKEQRAATERALGALAPDHIVPWLVRPLPASVLAAAGMMELFGHGQDVADALDVEREHTDRIGHLVGFAVRTWDFGYTGRGLDVPEVQFRFEITAPSGKVWEFGPADAADRISGPATDFCLLVTRRRHPADLAITATGPEAPRWLEIAQAYRGPGGKGRTPGQFKPTADAAS